MEPKGWNPEGTYTGLGQGTVRRWDDRPSQNPYPKNMPDVNFPFQAEIPQIIKMMRRYEHAIHQDVLLYEGGDGSVLRTLTRNIRCFKAIKEEMTTGVYFLPKNLQWFLDNDNREEQYV